ncbi:hypothetical protein F7725_002036, partial [Dissostichus mawsoni]
MRNARGKPALEIVSILLALSTNFFFMKPKQGFTFGREALEPELWVVMVSTVVIPSATLAGAASILIQKDTHERMTMRRDGMYIWIRTVPSLKIRSSLLSVVTSWKLAPFSLAKKRSGFHMESNMDGSRSREESGYLLYASRGSSRVDGDMLHAVYNQTQKITTIAQMERKDLRHVLLSPVDQSPYYTFLAASTTGNPKPPTTNPSPPDPPRAGLSPSSLSSLSSVPLTDA